MPREGPGCLGPPPHPRVHVRTQLHTHTHTHTHTHNDSPLKMSRQLGARWMTARTGPRTDAGHGARTRLGGAAWDSSTGALWGRCYLSRPEGSRPCSWLTKSGVGRGMSWESSTLEAGTVNRPAAFSGGTGGQGVRTDSHLWRSPHRTEPTQGLPIQPAD